MKIHKSFQSGFLIYLALLIPFCTIFTTVSTPQVQAAVYNPNSSVTFDVNETLSYQTVALTPTSIELWMSQFQNWTYNSDNSTSYDQHSILEKEIQPVNSSNITLSSDLYNNSYEYYEKNFTGFGSADNSFFYSANYLITLYSQSWNVSNSLSTNLYDTTSWLYQYYTQSLPYCQVNDSLIQSTAFNLTHGITSIPEIALAIYMFVIKNMTYQIQTDVLGAKQALIGKIGDCSEFSSLMVALLRASGIPARKVLGIGIVAGNIQDRVPNYNPTVNQQFNYTINNIPAHAWVEYYVPTIGWVSCDPTWGQAFYEAGGQSAAMYYFNRIDYCHLITTTGDWYEQGINPPLYVPDSNYTTGMPEFSYIYPLTNTPPGQDTFDYHIYFKVIATNLVPSTTTPPSINLFILPGMIGVLVVVLIFVIKPKNKNKIHQL